MGIIETGIRDKSPFSTGVSILVCGLPLAILYGII